MNEESEEYYFSSTAIEYLINVVLEKFTEASEAEFNS